MQPSPSDNELDELLGRGTVGAARRDAILDRVLAQVKTERGGVRRRRWPVAGLGVAVAAAAAWLLLVPRWSHTDVPVFRAKGSSTPATTTGMALECVGGQVDACLAGSLLVVRVSGLRGYVAAWAEPVNGGERIWYFSADGYSPLVDGTAAPGAVTSRAARIGAEHGPGTYRVQLRLTEKPMTQTELLQGAAGSELASAHERLKVIAR